MPADREHADDDLRRRSISVKAEPGVPDRTPKACLKCRAQKMRCVGAADPPCKRCRRTGALCEFVPRANAAHPDSPETYSSAALGDAWRQGVETRLKQLEEANYRLQAVVDRLTGAGERRAEDWRLGVGAGKEGRNPYEGHVPGGDEGRNRAGREGRDDVFAGVHDAVDTLLRDLPASIAHHEAWSRSTVATLWASFCDHMPGLHFLSGQVSFSTPTPLLAASVLFMSTEHYPSDFLASYQSVYLDAFSRSIGSLASYRPPRQPHPHDTSTRAGVNGEGLSRRFDDVLGIILVGLVAIGWVDTVGLWVNAAYRLFLDGVHEDRGRRLSEWRGLWEGLRTVELEHCSLHLICPALPNAPPDPPFGNMTPLHPGAPNSTAGRDIDALLLIMQKRMKRFIARGLPTPWDRVVVRTSSGPGGAPHLPAGTNTAGLAGAAEFDAEDVAELRAWAADIDAWFSIHSFRTRDASNYVRAIVLLNYHLHKILVLSLLVPLPSSGSEGDGGGRSGVARRGSGGVAGGGASTELLQTARLALSIEASGFEVWSSWDLVIMTNATLFLLDAAVVGRGESKDEALINYHLGMLRATHQSAPSLRHTLAARLEAAMSSASVFGRDGDMRLAQGSTRGQTVATQRSESASITPTGTEGPVSAGAWNGQSLPHGHGSAPVHSSTIYSLNSPRLDGERGSYPGLHPGQPLPLDGSASISGQFEDLDRLFAPADEVWSNVGGLPMDPQMGMGVGMGEVEWPPYLLNIFGPSEQDQASMSGVGGASFEAAYEYGGRASR